MAKGTDVIIIGAGIIGSAAAWRLAQAGLKVVVYDPNAPGTGASQAALGVLGFHWRSDMPEPFNELCRLSRSYFPEVVQELQEITGLPIYFKAGGQISIALDDQELLELEEMYGANVSRRIPVEKPSPAEVKMLAPGLREDLKEVLFFPEDAWVDNTALNLAFVKASELSGASYQRGAVQSCERVGDRAIGVRVAGRLVEARYVVLAAGCWSGQIDNVPEIPVYPVRGQALMISGQPIQRIVMSPRGYIVPKGKDQTMIGATVEKAGFNDNTTLGGLAEISSAAVQMAPFIARSEFLGAWSGLRPGTPDNLPLIGPFKEMPGLISATGHFRNGILFAPATASMVTAAILGETPPLPLAPFLPDRRFEI